MLISHRQCWTESSTKTTCMLWERGKGEVIRNALVKTACLYAVQVLLLTTVAPTFVHYPINGGGGGKVSHCFDCNESRPESMYAFYQWLLLIIMYKNNVWLVYDHVSHVFITIEIFIQQLAFYSLYNEYFYWSRLPCKSIYKWWEGSSVFAAYIQGICKSPMDISIAWS